MLLARWQQWPVSTIGREKDLFLIIRIAPLALCGRGSRGTSVQGGESLPADEAFGQSTATSSRAGKL